MNLRNTAITLLISFSAVHAQTSVDQMPTLVTTNTFSASPVPTILAEPHAVSLDEIREIILTIFCYYFSVSCILL